MLYLINPGKKKKKARPMAKRRKRAGAKKRPSAKQVAARKKFAAMARARGKAARSLKSNGGGTMARRKRRVRKNPPKAAAKRRRRSSTIKSVTRNGKSVSRRSWRASGFRRNPRRRSRRNPPIFAQLKDLGMGVGGVMAGAALGGKVRELIPFTDTPGQAPLIEAAKAGALAIGLKLFGRRFLPAGLIDPMAIGIALGPAKNLIVHYAPQSAAYLGDVVALPSFPGVRSLAAYSQNGLQAYDSEEGVLEEGLGSYTDGW